MTGLLSAANHERIKARHAVEYGQWVKTESAFAQAQDDARALLAHIDALQSLADAAVADRSNVNEIHAERTFGRLEGYCKGCGREYPCPTIKAVGK